MNVDHIREKYLGCWISVVATVNALAIEDLCWCRSCYSFQRARNLKKNVGDKPMLVGKICPLPLIKVGLTNLLKIMGNVLTSPYVPATLIQLNFWCSGQTFTSQKWIPVSNNLASHTRKILLPRCLNLNKTRSSCKLICSEYSSVDDLFRK